MCDTGRRCRDQVDFVGHPSQCPRLRVMISSAESVTLTLSYAAGFLLPRGYPDSVSDDYLAYQLRAFPCHIFVSPTAPPPQRNP